MRRLLLLVLCAAAIGCDFGEEEDQNYSLVRYGRTSVPAPVSGATIRAGSLLIGPDGYVERVELVEADGDTVHMTVRGRVEKGEFLITRFYPTTYEGPGPGPGSSYLASNRGDTIWTRLFPDTMYYVRR